MKPILRTGYDFAHRVVISFDGAVESQVGRTIKACLKSADKSAELIADVTLDDAATGADYVHGAVVVAFPAAATALLTAPCQAWIELAIIDGAQRYPVGDIEVCVEKGWVLS